MTSKITNHITIKKMVKYLRDIEENNQFIAWDSKTHAKQNLITVFGCTENEATLAVDKARVPTKQEREMYK